jgi:hypothetical protein
MSKENLRARRYARSKIRKRHGSTTETVCDMLELEFKMNNKKLSCRKSKAQIYADVREDTSRSLSARAKNDKVVIHTLHRTYSSGRRLVYMLFDVLTIAMGEKEDARLVHPSLPHSRNA